MLCHWQHAAVRHMTCRGEGFEHKIFMDSFLSPRLLHDYETRKINSSSTKQPNRKDMPPDFGPKKNWNSKGVTRVKTRGCLYALVWKDRWEVYMPTNVDPPPAEENFCYDSNHPVTLWNLTLWLVYLANWVCWHFWSCGQQLFSESTYFQVYHKIVFPPLDLMVLNS